MRFSGRSTDLSSFHLRDPPVRMQTTRPSPGPREAFAVFSHNAFPGMTMQACVMLYLCLKTSFTRSQLPILRRVHFFTELKLERSHLALLSIFLSLK